MLLLPRATAFALLCALPDIAAAVALAARQQTAAQLPPQWITVDAAGSARTVTPQLTLVGGTTSTISPPPDELTRVQTWRMSAHGTAVTTTTRAPIATATPSGSTGSPGGGVMLKCQDYVGIDAPLCAPYRGSLLNPGTTYYLTWYVDFFGSNPDQDIEVQVSYDGGPVLLTDKMPASVGFYAWSVPADFLERNGGGRAAVEVTWSINFGAPDGSKSIIHGEGPTVTITREQMLVDDGLPKGAGGSPAALAIAVPVVVIVLLVFGLGGFCFWSWRKKGVVPGAAAIGALKRRSTGGGGGGGGYGERRSRSERAAGQQQQDPVTPRPAGPGDQLPDDKFPGIQLTDRDSWSPTSPSSGRNVFQEEIRRQETGRR
ncbi:hypothetical protein RB594_007068 [Gaeumannomyces avenae]